MATRRCTTPRDSGTRSASSNSFAAARARYELGQAFFGQGHVLYEVSGDFAGAVTHHHAAIQLNPHDARGHHHAYLATVLASRGSLDGAAEEVHACIRLGGVRALRDSLGQQVFARFVAARYFLFFSRRVSATPREHQ